VRKIYSNGEIYCLFLEPNKVVERLLVKKHGTEDSLIFDDQGRE